jgi:hypothetical protein
VVPRQVSSDSLHQGGGEGAGQLLVDGRRRGQLQVGHVHTGQGEDLAEKGEEVSILCSRVTFQPAASRGQGREEALEADSKPVGQVKSRSATSSQVAAGLLGQLGLSSGLRAGEAKAASWPLCMALMEGQPLKVASPEEIGHQATKAGGWGRLSREGRWGGQRKEVGNVPGLGEDKNLQDLDPRLKSLQLRVIQDWRVLSISERTLSQESWTVLEKTGEMVKPRTFTEVEARIHWRGQSWRLAQEPRLMIAVLRFLLRGAPEAASKSLQARSTLTKSWRSSPRTWTSSINPKEASLMLATRRPVRTASSRTRKGSR